MAAVRLVVLPHHPQDAAGCRQSMAVIWNNQARQRPVSVRRFGQERLARCPLIVRLVATAGAAAPVGAGPFHCPRRSMYHLPTVRLGYHATEVAAVPAALPVQAKTVGQADLLDHLRPAQMDRSLAATVAASLAASHRCPRQPALVAVIEKVAETCRAAFVAPGRGLNSEAVHRRARQSVWRAAYVLQKRVP